MLTLHSPAKINLFLRILRRRPDGYHDLASLFQTIDLKDKIDLALDSVDSLTCTDPTLPTDHSNLILQAADLFRKKTGLKFGLRAHLDKKIPSQAGLGGGSGNAATALWGLNFLLGNPASTEELQIWSAEIGSDIPFFFSTGSAYCTGRGEHVLNQPQPILPSIWIVKPSIGASTPGVYSRLKLLELPSRDPEHSLKSFDGENGEYYNDLEQAAFDLVPDLANVKKELLGRGFDTVMLCGSGSSFFCIGEANPYLEKCICYRVNGINRELKCWY